MPEDIKISPSPAGASSRVQVAVGAQAGTQAGAQTRTGAPASTNGQQVYKLDDPSVTQPKTSFLEKLVQESSAKTAASGAPATPAAPQALSANGAAPGNVFTKLFSAQKPAAQVSIGPAAPAPSLYSLLGPKPAISQRILMEEEAKIAKIAKTVLGVCVLFSIGVYAFFYSRLDTNFVLFSDSLGPNTAQLFEQSNSKLQKVKTDINLENYRMLRLFLDDVNRQIDVYNHRAFTADSAFSTKVERSAAKQKMAEERGKIKDTLTKVQAILSQPINIDTYLPNPTTKEEREQFFTTLLKDEISRQKTALANNDEQLRVFDNLTRLVDNKSFRNFVGSQDLAVLTKDEQRPAFDAMLARIRAESTDEFSAVNNIKVKRINWAQVIQSLHDVTRKVDDYYGKGFFKDAGGFLFNSYQFDSATGRISISGITKTPDSKTFSIIANLVDAVEKSNKFKDIDFRSFAKSRDDSGDYSSSLNLDFSMQTGLDNRDVVEPRPAS